SAPRAGAVAFQRQQISEWSLERRRPQLHFRTRTDQTHVHTNIRGIRTGTRLNGDRSLDERTNSELLCNHRERLIGVPKRPYGRRGSHLERSHLTERRYELIVLSLGQRGRL